MLRHFLEDIPRWEKLVPQIYIHCDSQLDIEIHKAVSLNICIIYIIPSNNYSQLE